METRRRSRLDLDEREFYALWIVSVATYGVGDTLTTLAITGAPHVRETNAVVAAALQLGGSGGLAALKIAALLGSLLVSTWAARERERLLYYLPPVLLSVVGAFATVHNAGLLWF
jgi:hypothetical protein